MESYIRKTKNKRISFIEKKLFNDLDKKISFSLISILISLLSFNGNKLFLAAPILALSYLLDFSYYILALLSLIVSGILLGPRYFLFFAALIVVFTLFSLLNKKIKINLILKTGLTAFLSDLIIRGLFILIYEKSLNLSVLSPLILGVFIYRLGVSIIPLLNHQKIYKIKQNSLLALSLLIVLSLSGVSEIVDNMTLVYILLSICFIFMAHIYNISLFAYVSVWSMCLLYLVFDVSIENISLIIVPALAINLINTKKKYYNVLTYFLAYVFIILLQNKDMNNYQTYLIPSLSSLIFAFMPSLLVDEVRLHVLNIETFEKENIAHIKKIEYDIAHKLEGMANLFQDLADEYLEDESFILLEKQMANLYKNLCINCPKNKVCFKMNENRENLSSLFLRNLDEEYHKEDIDYIISSCLKPSRFLEKSQECREDYLKEYKYNEQYKNLKNALSYQALGFKTLLNKYANKVKVETLPLMNHLEEQIKNHIESLNINLIYLDTYTDIDKKLNIILDIQIDKVEDIYHLILPSLENLLNKTLKVSEIKEISLDDYYSITIKEYEPREYIFGVSQRAIESSGNGDSYITFKTDTSLIYAISDGMGSGEEARKQSKATLKFLKSVLLCDMDIKNSVLMINSMLKAKNRFETYATLDLLCLDNKTMKASFSKNGSPYSYIYRDNELIKIDSSSLPVGIVEEVKVFDYEIDLKENDLIIMFSDGISDNEAKLKMVLDRCKDYHPQVLTKEIIDEFTKEKLKDDTTVMVIKIKKNV